MMYVGVSDKILVPWLETKGYYNCSNEGEAIAIAAGYYLSTGIKATAFMSADGLCNAMNFLTSWVLPEKIQLHLVISTGRTEPPHIVMTEILSELLELLKRYDPQSERITYELVQE